jgi:putative glutamine amidotransferase
LFIGEGWLSVPLSSRQRLRELSPGHTFPLMKTPVIGITVDSEEPGGYSKFPWYALRENYCGAVTRAGGLPLPLPHEAALADKYLDMIDGLLVSGGAFDVDPAMFGAEFRHDTVITKDRRSEFEQAVVGGALKQDMPILGICGGQQLLHVMLGGSLIQHIPDEVSNALAHEQPNPRDEPGHDVIVVKDTLLYQIIGNTTLSVNSAHHQAAKDEPAGVIINARAPDGVIEGIEAPDKKFCLGVQWHPEFSISSGDDLILKAFINACLDNL